MVTTQLELETVTPMFLHGHENKIVELRPPPFKALFRYWWRTVQDCDANSLREAEAKWFGSTKGKAPFSIRISVSKELDQTKYKPLPHKPDNDRFGKKIDAFGIGQPFELSLITKTGTEGAYYQQIAKLGFLLGGIGARSRRGFGSIREANWNFSDIPGLRQEILDTLNTVAKPNRFQINRAFSINGKTVEVIESERRTHYPPEYPVTQRVFFGKPTDKMGDLLKEIGQATSNAKSDNKDDTLGGGVPRMASPVIVRIQVVNSQYIPIVTQLHSPYPISRYVGRHSSRKPKNIPHKQLKFINDIIELEIP